MATRNPVPGMINAGPSEPGGAPVAGKRHEMLTFLVATFVLIPGASVAFVGAYGLIIWIIQLIFGPPGPPS